MPEMKRVSACFVGGLILSSLPAAAPAQVTIDVAKITCDQYIRQSVAATHSIALWVSGYRHGLTRSTLVESETLKGSDDKFFDYCIKNREMPLLQAVDNVLGPDK
jgi:hypothetical protein